MIEECIEPSDLALPEKFKEFRTTQLQALDEIVYSEKRFVGLGMPVGSGKTLAYMAVQKMTGWRAAVLTGTKGLQDQINGDFGRMDGFVDIRGKGNYKCGDFRHLNCDEGPMAGCRFKSGGCEYMGKVQMARACSGVVSTNYDYWMSMNKYSSLCHVRDSGEVDNPFDLLVMDEGHLAAEKLAGFMAVELRKKEVLDCAGDEIGEDMWADSPKGDEVREWSAWAGRWKREVEDEYKGWLESWEVTSRLKAGDSQMVRESKRREGFIGKLVSMIGMSGMVGESGMNGLADKRREDGWVGEWMEDKYKNKYLRFDPISPGAMAERYLFTGIPKIAILSGTLKPKNLSMLHLGRDKYDFREWMSPFPPNLRPVYWLKTGRIVYGSSEETLRRWLLNIDEIIRTRCVEGGRKGIIHTISFDRQHYLKKHSRYAKWMLFNDNEQHGEPTDKIVKKFKETQGGVVLVGPSFSTGYDFADDSCRWQVISKMPFPSTKSKIMRVRKELDPKYMDTLTSTEFGQMLGRGNRHDKDWCEIFVTDDNVEWFVRQNRSLMPIGLNIRPITSLPPLLKAG